MSNIPDIIIIGAGPGGIMSAYSLNKKYPNKYILLLEQNEYTLEQYINDGYYKLEEWFNASSNPKNMYSFNSVEQKTCMLGKGLGGGTLHFGLQFINNEKIINEGYKEWSIYFDKVTEILKPQKYDYSNVKKLSGNIWNDIYLDLIENSNELNYNVYNNNIYSSDIEKGLRLLIGKIILNNPMISIIYNVKIDRLIFNYNNTRIDYLLDVNQNQFRSDLFILSAGAIQSTAILQRSGIGPSLLLNSLNIPIIKNLPVGEHLFDHGGINIAYRINSFRLDEKSFDLIYNDMNIYLYKVIGNQISKDDYGKIYDFTDWIKKHPGGENAIKKWIKKDFTLIFPHDNVRWETYKSNLKYIGNYNEIVPFSLFQFSDDLKNKLRISLDPKKIVGHLQTRSPNLSWQIYISTLPNDPSLLIITYAQCTKLGGKGKVYINSTNGNDNPTILLNEFENDNGIKDIKEAFDTMNKIFVSMNFERLLNVPIDDEYIKTNYESIWHYTSTCQIDKVIDETQKVKEVNNLYIADASILPKPWGGSTSVPALVTGYRLSEKLNYYNI